MWFKYPAVVFNLEEVEALTAPERSVKRKKSPSQMSSAGFIMCYVSNIAKIVTIGFFFTFLILLKSFAANCTVHLVWTIFFCSSY